MLEVQIGMQVRRPILRPSSVLRKAIRICELTGNLCAILEVNNRTAFILRKKGIRGAGTTSGSSISRP